MGFFQVSPLLFPKILFGINRCSLLYHDEEEKKEKSSDSCRAQQPHWLFAWIGLLPGPIWPFGVICHHLPWSLWSQP